MVENSRRTFLKLAAAGGTAIAVTPLLHACKKHTEAADDCSCDTSDEVADGVAPKVLKQPEKLPEARNPRPVATPVPSSDPANAIGEELFNVEIKGLYTPVPDVEMVDAGRVTVAIEQDSGVLKYGKSVYEDLKLTVKDTEKVSKLRDWASSGASASQRDITVHLLDRDKTTVLKTINCFGCFPSSLDAGSHASGDDVKTVTLTCTVSRVEVT